MLKIIMINVATGTNCLFVIYILKVLEDISSLNVPLRNQVMNVEEHWKWKRGNDVWHCYIKINDEGSHEFIHLSRNIIIRLALLQTYGLEYIQIVLCHLVNHVNWQSFEQYLLL